MVYFQVEGLYAAFQELTELESNGWQARLPSPKKRKTQVTTASSHLQCVVCACCVVGESRVYVSLM